MQSSIIQQPETMHATKVTLFVRLFTHSGLRKEDDLTKNNHESKLLYMTDLALLCV